MLEGLPVGFFMWLRHQPRFADTIPARGAGWAAGDGGGLRGSRRPGIISEIAV